MDEKQEPSSEKISENGNLCVAQYEPGTGTIERFVISTYFFSLVTVNWQTPSGAVTVSSKGAANTLRDSWNGPGWKMKPAGHAKPVPPVVSVQVPRSLFRLIVPPLPNSMPSFLILRCE